jgi:hypothetical protein
MSRRIVAIVSAVVATVAAFFLAKAAGAELSVPAEIGGDMSVTQEMPVGAVVIFTLVVSLLSWGLAALLERFTTKARTIWVIVAAIVFAGSLASVFRLGLDGSDAVWQSALHLVFGVILVAGFWGTFKTSTEK